jgi:hypothetical protein
MPEEACGKEAVKKTQLYGRNKRFRDGHETAGSFCTNALLHPEQKWPRIASQAQSDGFGHSVIFLVLATALFVPFSANKMSWMDEDSQVPR